MLLRSGAGDGDGSERIGEDIDQSIYSYMSISIYMSIYLCHIYIHISIYIHIYKCESV